MIDGWIGLLIAFLVVTSIVIGELFLGDDNIESKIYGKYYL